MPTRKISDLPVPCLHPRHHPPFLQVFPPGVYKHTCPACGTEQPFVVERLHWVDMPLGTRAHSSIGGHWERVPNGWRAQSGCVFPTPGGDATHVSYPDKPELHIQRAAQPEPPPIGDGAEVLPMVIADLQARSEKGRAKYGTTLRVNNGRNALMDAYQEAQDLTMYLRQKLEEEKRKKVYVVMTFETHNDGSTNIDGIYSSEEGAKSEVARLKATLGKGWCADYDDMEVKD